jgi:hypothetical protein
MGLLDRLRGAPGDEVPAEATLLWLAPTNKAARMEGKRNVPYVLRLRVMPPDTDAYELEHETVVPHDRLPMNGDTLQVRISPHDPTRIEIDWNAQPKLADRALASADAARRGDAAGAAEALGFTPVDDERQSER